jgi:uncharacterized protein (DUF433 family)
MNPDWRNRIESNPRILRGKPCFSDTRIPVCLILGYLASGTTTEAIVRQFPDLKALDISAALQYARDLADFDTVTI